MQQTSNYNLNLPEGTDVVNPLVDYNPNFSAIDGIMKANSDRTVGRATCIKSGTTHVVTRSNTESNIINFTATGDWNEGDTMTIDSTIVSVFLPDGTAALNGAYLINSEVFGILNGTRFTLYSNISDISNIEAANVSFDNSGSDMTSTNVQGAIIEVNNKLKNANYTTNEKIVGTWVDGTTLYEKTIDCGYLPDTASKNVAHGISNIGAVVSISGTAFRPGDYMPIPYSRSDGNYSFEIQVSTIFDASIFT